MTDAQARKLILEIVGEVDYDHAKYFDLEISEDPEDAEHTMERLIKIVHRHMTHAAPKPVSSKGLTPANTLCGPHWDTKKPKKVAKKASKKK